MEKYPDLKCYLQANFKDFFTEEVQTFVNNKYDGGSCSCIGDWRKDQF